MARELRWLTFPAALSIVVAAVGTVAPPASASIVGDALTITAKNAGGDAASLLVSAPPGASIWVWSIDEPMEMRSPRTGELIAVLSPDGQETRVEYLDQHVVLLNFAVQAGPSTTSFSIASGLQSFPTITADGRASVGMSVTDSDGDGATLTGIGDPSGSQGAYLAQYNGFAGTLSGTTFAEVIQSLVAGSFASATTNVDVPPLGFLPILDPVSDMSVLVSFSLTANDQGSGTSTFVVVQRPLAVEAETWAVTKSLYR